MTRTRPLIAATGAAVLLAAGFPSSALAQEGGGIFDVDTTDDTVDAAPGDGECADADGACSLRAAVQEANEHDGASSVRLGSETYVLSVGEAGDESAESGDLDITGNVVINGRGSVIDLAGSGDRAFDVAADASLAVSRVDIVNGATADTESGGAIRNAGILDVSRSNFRDNVVTGEGASGGAIANGGDLRVQRSEFTGNEATRAGGAIEATEGSATSIDRSTLDGNTAGPMPGNGGAFHLTGAGTVDISRSVVSGNTAANEGGGVWNSALGDMTLDRVEFTGNVASGVEADTGGGAIFNQGNDDNTSGGVLTVVRSTLSGNTAPEGSGSGGGILNEGGDLTVLRSRFVDNEAARAGGGIETVAGTVTIDRTWMSRNATGPEPGNGGGLHMSGAGVVDVTRSQFYNNVAANEGGALWNSSVGVMTLDDVSLRFNAANGVEADNGGGALFNQGDGETGGTLSVTDSKITHNTALEGAGSGGGILNENGSLTVVGSDISRNSSARAGGGIETVGGTVDVDRVVFDRNATGSEPGNGGALHISGPGSVDVNGSQVTGNFAANEGGGLWNSTVGTLTVTASDITDNEVGVAENGPNVFQQAPLEGGVFTVDGETIPEGPNQI
ncbi:right-handed parallel beta-helix repeat-containing protein [Ilumatobacter nonamiensis]|uniref:right-handed parallel beta-helix repeat-containing protein n=1 Tax=Ilumatobacter nonamiensis TaxID=467093 RepID=UPI00034A8BA3|nr:right-handed parallel beta-helix repeat-containing protein [Ilumatobacter nonamiensis]